MIAINKWTGEVYRRCAIINENEVQGYNVVYDQLESWREGNYVKMKIVDVDFYYTEDEVQDKVESAVKEHEKTKEELLKTSLAECDKLWARIREMEKQRKPVEVPADLAESLDYFLVLKFWKRDDVIKAIVEGVPSHIEEQTKHIYKIVDHMKKGRAIVFDAIYYGYKAKPKTQEEIIIDILRKHGEWGSHDKIAREIMNTLFSF